MIESGNFTVTRNDTNFTVSNYTGTAGTSYSVDGESGVVFNTVDSHSIMTGISIVLGNYSITSTTSNPSFYIYASSGTSLSIGLLTDLTGSFMSMNSGDYVSFTVIRS